MVMTSHLQLEPRWRLMAGAVELRAAQALLAVGGVAGWALADEEADVLDETTARRKAPDAEREEDPAAGVRGLGGVLCELLAYLAVDFVSGERAKEGGREVPMQVCEVRGKGEYAIGDRVVEKMVVNLRG